MKKHTSKYILILLCFFTIYSCVKNPENTYFENKNETHTDQYFLIGNYNAEGIRLIKLSPTTNSSNETLSDLGMVALANMPSYLTLGAAHQRMYAVTLDDQKHSHAVYFLWNKSTQRFEQKQRLKLEGISACHISMNAQGSALLISHYRSGNLHTLNINTRSGLMKEKAHFKNTGRGPTSRQGSPHLHFADWSPHDERIFATDLGTDEILAFNPTLNLQARTKLPTGSGPRHLAFHPKNTHVYSINELNNTISHFQLGHAKQALTLIRHYSFPDLENKSTHLASAIKISHDGKFLYSLVRGANRLYAHRIHQSGELTLIQSIPTGGQGPRDFNFSLDGRRVLIANQQSNSITVFQRDPESGNLKPSTVKLHVDSPSHILSFSPGLKAL